MKINHLDLFSGIGGFHLGFERAGFKIKSYFSEVDKHAIAVYKHQFPNSTYVGSVKDVRGAELPSIDLITFGSPCQDFSLAGKRQGMAGQRSSLILEAIRLIKEKRPRVFIWENVKGTFSSNSGEDFAAILKEFTDIGGYRLEWQLLNTSWFLPQNRERIYLVGYSSEVRGDWPGVFPIGESDSADSRLLRIEVVGNHGTGGQQGLIYGEGGLSPTINASTYKDPVKLRVKQIGTRLDSGGKQPYQQDRVYDAEGIVPALNQGKSDLILKVKSATKSGYEEAVVGDSVNLSQPNSKTRRGRVGKQKAQTLETSCNQAVVGEFQIRRLTPIETERLQGFPDNHTAFGDYDGSILPVSNSHRYKQCGNAVTVDVVQAVAERTKKLF